MSPTRFVYCIAEAKFIKAVCTTVLYLPTYLFVLGQSFGLDLDDLADTFTLVRLGQGWECELGHVARTQKQECGEEIWREREVR